MSLTIPSLSRELMLQTLVNKFKAKPWVLRLYTNMKAPADTDTEDDYTEAHGHGYRAQTLTPSLWEIMGKDPVGVSYPEVPFMFSGPLGNVYGYFVTQGSEKLLFAERFADGPYAIRAGGDRIDVRLSLSLD